MFISASACTCALLIDWGAAPSYQGLLTKTEKTELTERVIDGCAFRCEAEVLRKAHKGDPPVVEANSCIIR